MGIIWVLLLFITIFSISHVTYKIIREIRFFRKKKVYHLGNGWKRFLVQIVYQKKSLVDLVKDQYNDMRQAGVTVAGNYDFGIVNYLITDLEMVKNVLVKDFDHFVNRRQFNVPKSDGLVKKMLIFTKDDQWKQLRSKMSPTFTTGKIKRMFPLFNDSSVKLVKFVEERMAASPAGEIDLWEGYSKFTMDTIASVVCGMDSKAFDQLEPSVFEQMGRKLQLQFNPKQFLKFAILIGYPKLAEKLGWSLFGEDLREFFAGAIKASIKDRERTGVKRNDFVQLMLEAREGSMKLDESELDTFEKDAMIKDDQTSGATSIKELLDDDGIVSNCVLFILAGFDTTQSVLLFAAYALAIHPDIQDKLRSEVEEVLDRDGGKFTYESLHKMQYLDMVINETLRFYPPAPATDRGCTKDYMLPGTDILVTKGSAVAIPILGFHHDERYYPEPEKFDPERFSPENKGKIHPYAFIPFGQGPRNCIGMRFALTEVKLAIAQLVHNFQIEPSAKTLIPMEYQNAGSLKPKDGMWLSLKKIQQSEP